MGYSGVGGFFDVKIMASQKNILVAGAGAAGLTAALFAARSGARVLLAEAAHLPGRKISASGNGRCNLSNTGLSPERYHGAPALAAAAFTGFGAEQASAFFTGLGVSLREEDQGRIFPSCGRSRAVLDALLLAASESGVSIAVDSPVSLVRPQSGRFLCRYGGAEEVFDSVVLACGSCAYPQLGGGNSGYELARSLAHAVTPLSPALVPLCVKEKSIKRLKGIRAQAELAASLAGKTLSSSSGELLFTEYGLSGPCALAVSREAVKAMSGGPVTLHINLFPEISDASFKRFIEARAQSFPSRKMKEFLAGLLHESIINLACDRLGSPAEKPVSALSSGDFKSLISMLRDWRLELAGPLSWREAMVCAGGVCAEGIDPRTMGSLKVPGIYFCGELLDVDGDSGGFNLHFAWSSGRQAGLSAAGR